MNYKITNTLRKSKFAFIVLVILWISLSIVFVMPLNISIVDSTQNRNT